MNRPPLKKDREEGAVAILVAILMVVLVGLAAFAVDFGLAYDSKRELQNASDAAALAAAAIYAEYPGTCAELQANSTAFNEALAAGRQVMDENRPGADNPGDFEANCSDTGGKQLIIKWESEGTTDAYFGQLYGATDYDTSRRAAAIVGVPSTVGLGVRPIALCSDSIPATLPSTTVEKVEYTGPNDQTGPCPGVKNSGNWWSIQCPGDDPSNISTAMREGCTNPVSVVEGADSEPDPVALRALLLGACPADNKGDEDCLAAKSGNFPELATGPSSPLESLFGKEFILPVFCGGPPTPCDPAGVDGDLTGANVQYPVYQLAGARLCGYHWGNKNLESTSDPAHCDPATFDASVGTVDDYYLFLKFTNVLVSGTVTPGEGCAIGTGCDAGARSIALVD